MTTSLLCFDEGVGAEEKLFLGVLQLVERRFRGMLVLCLTVFGTLFKLVILRLATPVASVIMMVGTVQDAKWGFQGVEPEPTGQLSLFGWGLNWFRRREATAVSGDS